MSECEYCKGCYDHIWGCTECPYAEEHEQSWKEQEALRKEAVRLAKIEAAVTVFGEEARG